MAAKDKHHLMKAKNFAGLILAFFEKKTLVVSRLIFPNILLNVMYRVLKQT